MKKSIHPSTYRPVLFEDLASGAKFLIGSTIASKETASYEGKEYPKVTVEISSKSHPFYTGEDRVLDKAGRVERFKARVSAREAAKKQ
jgi:large subunit ribosomal protein L31